MAFDGQWVLQREEERGDVVGFYHTHPGGSPNPSQRDLNTMRAWCSCFGKPLLCVIESPEGLGAFRFDDDQSTGVRLGDAERFPQGVVVVVDSENADKESRHGAPGDGRPARQT